MRYLLKLATLHAHLHYSAEMAKKFDSSSHKLVDIGDKTHQPKSHAHASKEKVWYRCIKDQCFQRSWFEK